MISEFKMATFFCPHMLSELKIFSACFVVLVVVVVVLFLFAFFVCLFVLFVD